MFINASPELWDILMFGQDTLAAATAVLVIGGGFLGILGAVVSLLPTSIRNAVMFGASTRNPHGDHAGVAENHFWRSRMVCAYR